jgi:hypothetical protein
MNKHWHAPETGFRGLSKSQLIERIPYSACFASQHRHLVDTQPAMLGFVETVVSVIMFLMFGLSRKLSGDYTCMVCMCYGLQ